MSTLLATAFALLVVSWHAPQIGRTLAGAIAFVSFPMILKELSDAIDQPPRFGCVVREGPALGWWLIGLGFALVMLALAEVAIRRRRSEGGLARAIVRR